MDRRRIPRIMVRDPTGFRSVCTSRGDRGAAQRDNEMMTVFLSVLDEFTGRAERAENLFCSAATDLRRQPCFQGNGLVGLVQSCSRASSRSSGGSPGSARCCARHSSPATCSAGCYGSSCSSLPANCSATFRSSTRASLARSCAVGARTRTLVRNRSANCGYAGGA